MNCLDDNLVAAYEQDLLAAEEKAQVTAHLAQCSHCRALVDALSGAVSAPPSASDPHEPTDPLLGQIFDGTYQLLYPIGSGGMGRVYAGEHLRLKRKVAIKMLNPELRHHPDLLERFKREAQICAGLGNHHIVDVHDFNQLPDGTPYMVMELLRGESLAQRIALDGPLPPVQIVELMMQVCSALACTHGEGILHRDLKPSNIFLCEEDDADSWLVKVLDFGISKAQGTLATLTSSKEILGTPAYISPEMAAAKHKQVDERSDLFSLGAIAYEALGGRRPFEADSIPSVLYSIVHEDPPPLQEICPDIPAELAQLVMELLHKDKSRRPPQARALNERLNHLRVHLWEQQGGVWTPPAYQRSTGAADGAAAAALLPPTTVSDAGSIRSPRRRRLLWLSLGIAILTVSSLSSAWLLLRPPQPAPRPATISTKARPKVEAVRPEARPAPLPQAAPSATDQGSPPSTSRASTPDAGTRSPGQASPARNPAHDAHRRFPGRKHKKTTPSGTPQQPKLPPDTDPIL